MKFSLLACLFIIYSFSLSAQTWKELDKKVNELYEKDDYDNAILIAQQEIEAVKKEVGEIHPEYDSSLKQLGDLYLVTNQYEKAESIYISVKDFRKKVLGESSLDFAKILNTLGELYYDMGKCEKAEPLFIGSKNICKKILGEFNTYYDRSNSNLGLIYSIMGKYEKAEPIFIKSLIINKNISGKETLDYALSLENLAELYRHMNQYKKAEPYYLEANDIFKKSGENTDLATGLNNLGYYYMETGLYKKALTIFIAANSIIKTSLGENHPNYSFSLNNLANLYLQVGEFEKAESLFTESKERLKKILGENHPEFAFTIGSLANFYLSIGEPEKAEPLMKQVNEINKTAYGENTPQFALGLNNLGVIYEDMGNYEKAEQFFINAKKIYTSSKATNYLNYASLLDNLARIRINNNRSAESLFIESMNIKKAATGNNSPDFANSLNNLGDFYTITGKYRKAIKYYLQAKMIRQTKLGKANPDYSESCLALGNLFWTVKKPKTTTYFYKEAFNSQNIQRNRIFTFTNEKEKNGYLKKYKTYNNDFFSFYTNAGHYSNQGFTYHISLSNRNLILSSLQQLRESINNINDTGIAHKYDKWTGLKEELSFWYAKPITQRPDYVKDLEDEANSLEKDLTRSSSAFKNEQTKSEITWKNIQQNLKRGEAAIEFVDFNFFNGKRYTDSIYYIALLLRKDKPEPLLIKLFEKKQLDSLLSKKENNEDENISNLYAYTKKNSDKKSLYDLIWKPMEGSLTGITKIYFAASGNLHTIAFAALPVGDNKVLSEKYQLIELNTTASVTNQVPSFIKTSDHIQLYGGVKYDADSTALKQVANLYASDKGNIASRSIPGDIDRGSKFSYLPGTETEINSIEKQSEKTNDNVNILSGIDATEESFKGLNGNASPAVIHIATHGFFFPDPKEEKDKTLAKFETSGKVFKQSDNPLFRSGLLFAGANNAWTGKPVEGIEDGILTAYEVSNMYLPNTKLVVLSACETALGDIRGSEGVYGLQRAFKIAGVKNLVMSLWKVPDQATAEFMQIFYKNLFAKESISDAFYHAQTIMKNKYRDDPYKWAAWILVR